MSKDTAHGIELLENVRQSVLGVVDHSQKHHRFRKIGNERAVRGVEAERRDQIAHILRCGR